MKIGRISSIFNRYGEKLFEAAGLWAEIDFSEKFPAARRSWFLADYRRYRCSFEGI
jgi:hypothetical protein